MKFLIIIPAHNEEENIFFCLKSLELQDFQNFDLVVVNDGSTDDTEAIIQNFIQQSPIKARIKTLNLAASEHQPGAKIVRSFNAGLESVDLSVYDIICKFDADIIFPSQYLSTIHRMFTENPRLGMASGIVKILKEKQNVRKISTEILNFESSDGWVFENLSSPDHVRGPIKAYRKECLLKMNGLRPVLGWDNLDVMLAEMQGFTTQTDKNIWVKHLRPTAFKYKNQKAEKLGEYFYNLGLNFPLAFISSAKSSWKNRSFSELMITMNSFLKQKHNRVLSSEEMDFIRNLRWKKMWNKF